MVQTHRTVHCPARVAHSITNLDTNHAMVVAEWICGATGHPSAIAGSDHRTNYHTSEESVMNHATPDQIPFGKPATATPGTLKDEHAVLMREVRARAQALLTVTDEGRWPTAELQELLNYLRLEVLQQVVDEEWLLFRIAHHAPHELARLRREHLELRLATETLATAAATAGGDGALTNRQLSAITHDLLTQLEDHLAAEEKLTTDAGAAMPTTVSLGAQPHEWYALTEGPVIHLDELPGEQGVDAALGRLLRLQRTEQVEIRSSSDPSPLWQRLVATDPGGYGVEYLERGPLLWRVQITRRPEHWTPVALA